MAKRKKRRVPTNGEKTLEMAAENIWVGREKKCYRNFCGRKAR